MKLRTCCATVAISLLMVDLQAGSWLKDALSGKKDAEQASPNANAANQDAGATAQAAGVPTNEGTAAPASEAQASVAGGAEGAKAASGDNSGTPDATGSGASDQSNGATAPTTPEAPASAQAKEIVGDPIVLKIGGEVFRRSQVLAQLANLPAQLTQGIKPDQLFFMLREQMVSTTLIKKQAKAAGIDRTAAFLKRVEQLKDELLMREYIMREIGNKTEDEAALKVAYTEYLRNFKKEKETQIFHIMLTKENDARSVLIALGKGEDFSKLAREKSEAPSKSNGGDEGYVPINILPAQLKDPLSKLTKSGDYTKEFVKIENTYHIFKIGDSRDSTPLKYDEAKPVLRQTLLHKEMQKLVTKLEKQNKVERFNEDGTPYVAPAAPAASGATAAK